MVRPSRDQIESAWREAASQDLLSVLREPEGCPPEVLAIVQQEAVRRQLRFDASKEDLPARRDVITRLLCGLLRFFRHHPLIGAGCAGAGVRLCMWWVPWDPPGNLRPVVATLVVGVYLCCLTFACYPLRSYRTIAVTTLVGWLLFTLAGLPQVFETLPARPSAHAWVTGILLHGAIWWGAPCLLLCGVVFVRRRFWPAYPDGHCAVCGYDLRYLPEPRCPECGTPFSLGDDADLMPTSRVPDKGEQRVGMSP